MEELAREGSDVKEFLKAIKASIVGGLGTVLGKVVVGVLVTGAATWATMLLGGLDWLLKNWQQVALAVLASLVIVYLSVRTIGRLATPRSKLKRQWKRLAGDWDWLLWFAVNRQLGASLEHLRPWEETTVLNSVAFRDLEDSGVIKTSLVGYTWVEVDRRAFDFLTEYYKRLEGTQRHASLTKVALSVVFGQFAYFKIERKRPEMLGTGRGFFEV